MIEQSVRDITEGNQQSMHDDEDDAVLPHEHETGINDYEDVDAPIAGETGEQIAFLEFFNGLSQETIGQELPIFAEKELLVGRENPDKCHWIIPDFWVSKIHFRIYSVIYDKEKEEVSPLVYCEDLESTNGTYINSQCIGINGGPRRAFLLNHGDTIEIKPHWTFRFGALHQSDKTPQSPSQIRDTKSFGDQYIITHRLLGSGQFGQVYLAQEISGVQLACKIVDLSRCGEVIRDSGETFQDRARRGREEKRRIFTELKILSELSHPHIIDLKKAFYSNNFVYIFTELAAAGDLYSYLESRGGLCDLESRVLVTQMTLALDYMHVKKIAHRDLKPENILIMQTYEFSCRAVLTDFGFASHMDHRTGRFLSKVGTEGYCAPEVEKVNTKEGGYTLAADMWSLGKLTYTILIGVGVSRDDFSQYSQKVAEEFVEGKEHGSSITPRAKKFLRGVLVKDHTLRLTASQALQHSWLRKPLTEGAAIDEACQRISRFWKHRGHDERVIEHLPDRVLAQQNEVLASSSGTKPRRKKFPDVSPYPYFGLDRYFQQPKDYSTRGPLLDVLKEKEELFVTERPVAPLARRRHQNLRVVSVSAQDLFGMNQKKVNGGPSSEFENYGDSNEDELSLAPVPTSLDEGKDHYTIHPGSSRGARLGHSSGGFQRMHAGKRSWTEATDQNESRVREKTTEQIPHCSNAKEFGDMVKRMGLS